MKVLQINNVYDFGSTGKLTHDIHHALLNDGYQSVVLYGRRFKTTDSYVYKVCSELYSKLNNLYSRITGIEYGGCFFSTNTIIKYIEREQPDAVHLQCLNGHFVNIYRLLKYLKQRKIPTLITLHAEFMYTGGCAHAFDCELWRHDGCIKSLCPQPQKRQYALLGDKREVMWNKMKQAFSGFSYNLLVVSVSPWLMKRAKESTILKEYNHIAILNGVDISIFKDQGVDAREDVRSKLQIKKDKRIVFHATPHFSIDKADPKGGCYLVELAKRMEKENVVFVVAGPYKDDIKLPSNVILLGMITDKKQLAKLYSASDVTLIVSKRETFSMVCAESLCCGTPVVGFRAGAPETIAIDEYASFCEYGDIDNLQKNLISSFDLKDKTIQSKAHEKYNNEKMCKEYIEAYLSLVGTIK